MCSACCCAAVLRVGFAKGRAARPSCGNCARSPAVVRGMSSRQSLRPMSSRMEEALSSKPRQQPLQLRPRKLRLQPLKQHHDLHRARHTPQHHLLGLGTARLGHLGRIPHIGQPACQRRVAVGFGQPQRLVGVGPQESPAQQVAPGIPSRTLSVAFPSVRRS